MGKGDYAGLFRTFDVTELIVPRIELVPGWLQSAKIVLAPADIPVATTGPQ